MSFFFCFFVFIFMYIYINCVCVSCLFLGHDRYIGVKRLLGYTAAGKGGGVTGQHEELTGVGSIFLTPLAALFSRSERIQPKKEGRECARFSVCFLLLHRRVKSETRCVANANRQKVPSPFIFTSTFWLLPSFLFGL
jgi:hypothetical protein